MKRKEKLVIFMDMDNPILIFLIVVGSLIYKIYKGYQDEQVKAKQRMEQLKKQLQQKDSYPTQSNTTPKPQPVKTQQKPPLVTYHQKETIVSDIPTYDEVEIARQRKIEQQRIAAEKRLKDHKENSKKKVLEVEVLDHSHFDLKKAIIQQAILERPYKY